MSRQLGFIEPQLLTSVDQPPQGNEWLHEIKHDGYRTLLVVEGKQTRAYTRSGLDWTDRYPGIVSATLELDCRSAIIDGEVIVQDERGASDFDALMSAIRWHPHKLIFYAFDLLHLNGEDLRDRPLLERRAKLKTLLGTDETSPLQFSEEFAGDSAAFFRACAEHGLEGVVSKLVTSRYRSGRSKTWLKSKCFTESTFVVVGTDRDRKTGALRALLAHPDSAGLNYAGAAFIALSHDARTEFLAEVERLTTSLAAFKSSRLTDVKWCQPKLTVRVKHLAGSKTLRHATVRELVQ
jgi:bifunctional non-homologous end joining protein LigD